MCAGADAQTVIRRSFAQIFLVVQAGRRRSGFVPRRYRRKLSGGRGGACIFTFMHARSDQLTRGFAIARRCGIDHPVPRDRARHDRRCAQSVVLLACMQPRRTLFVNAEAVFFVPA
jgi:hypothetical protein